MDIYSTRIETAVSNNDYDSLSKAFSSMKDLGQGEQRSLCGFFVKTAVAKAGFLPRAFGSSAVMHCITVALSNLPVSVENAADTTLRKMLFEYGVEQNDYSGAARVLGGTRMETTPGSLYYKSPAEICDVYVKIAECFLEEDETVEADGAVTKAGTVVESIEKPEEHMVLILRYKSTYARVLDSNRKFLQAASRYHDLSLSATETIDADDLLNMLGRAATCAILAPSGAQRRRVLGVVYKDPRLSQLDAIQGFETHATVLRKMFLNQIIQPEELVKFESSLSDHQKAVMSDGLTIMERAVIEHNMVAVSKIYQSIYFTQLGKILGVSSAKAQKIAANMIMDSSLSGSIDQVEGLLNFEKMRSRDENSHLFQFQQKIQRRLALFSIA